MLGDSFDLYRINFCNSVAPHPVPWYFGKPTFSDPGQRTYTAQVPSPCPPLRVAPVSALDFCGKKDKD